jgi:hypothetical protein
MKRRSFFKTLLAGAVAFKANPVKFLSPKSKPVPDRMSIRFIQDYDAVTLRPNVHMDVLFGYAMLNDSQHVLISNDQGVDQ